MLKTATATKFTLRPTAETLADLSRPIDPRHLKTRKQGNTTLSYCPWNLSLAGLRRQVDPHWKRGMSCLLLGLGALQMIVADASARLMAWLPIPLQELEPCIPSRKAQRKQTLTWFSKVELAPRSRSPTDPTLQLAVE